MGASFLVPIPDCGRRAVSHGKPPASPTMTYCGRFAPSPTGPLHFGSLVTALGSFLDARHHQGNWLVRIENTDRIREVPGAAARILETLEQLGLAWDGEPLVQSTRGTAYDATLEGLRARGWVFPCSCTRAQIQRTGRAGPEGPIYPGTCRLAPITSHPERTLRLRYQGPIIHHHDRVLGPQSQDPEQFGDFVLRRADGCFAYQLAVVVDDIAQGINQVVRGADLASSTARQIYLYRLLGEASPAYAHLPLVRDATGKKLSKQDAARPVDLHQPLETLTRALIFLGQTVPDQTWRSPQQLLDWAVEHWNIATVPRDSISTSFLSS